MSFTSSLKRFITPAIAGVAATGILLTPVANATPENDAVVINEIYAAGPGVSGPILSDFVELYNPTDTPVSLDNLTLTVYGLSGDVRGEADLSGMLAADDHYLIKLRDYPGEYPADDATELVDYDLLAADLGIGAKNGSVELSSEDTVIDLVGYGVTERYEGSPSASPDTFSSLNRTDGVDTDDNSADFSSQEPTPQNSVREVEETPGEGEESSVSLADLSSRLSSLSS